MADAKLLRLGRPFPAVAPVSPSLQAFTLDETTDALEFIFAAPAGVASTTITRLGFRQGTLTGTAPVFRVSLQGVDGTGIPDGTIKASGSAFFDYTPTSGNNNKWQWVTLGASYAAAPGEILALVIKYQSGTIDASNKCSFTSTLAINSQNFPYVITNAAGVRTKTQGPLVYGFGTTGQAYGSPLDSTTNTSFNSGSTPDEHACRFLLPTGWGSTYRIRGVGLAFVTGAAGHVLRVTLYSGTTVLQQVDWDTDHATGFANVVADILFDESSLTDLSYGSVYRLGLAPQDTTNQNVGHITVAANADLDAYPGGLEMYTSTRTDAGAWTDIDTRRLNLDLLLDDLTGGAGGSSGAGLSRVFTGF